MSDSSRTFAPLSVFTKPWKELEVPALAEKVAQLGFEGVELPVRPEYQVEPEQAEAQLKKAANHFAEAGLEIFSVAGPLDERTIRACGAAGISILRTMLRIPEDAHYEEAVEQFRQQCRQLDPILAAENVVIGLQNHAGNFVGSAIGLMDVIRDLDPDHVSAVLDLGHTALSGEPEHLAIDIAWERLCMVNLKNAVRRRVPSGATAEAEWTVHWVGGRDGFTSWNTAANVLRQRGYTKPVCLTAEYRGEDGKPLAGDDVLTHLREDASYARQLFDQEQ